MKEAELVFIPSPGVGHIRSTVELAKLLACRDQRLSITVLVMNRPSDSSTSKYIQSLSDDVTSHMKFINLPQIVKPGPPSTNVSDAPVTLLTSFINDQLDPVRAAVTELMSRKESNRLVGFVIDLFCIPMIDIANEFGVPTYVFSTSNASFLGFMIYIQTLNDKDNLDMNKYEEDSEAELSVPCFTNPVPSKVFPSAILKKSGLELLVSIARRLKETKGIMVNTYQDLEANAIRCLSDDLYAPPVYSVGPILSLEGSQDKSDEATKIMQWLDDQPPSSVVFLCFGSRGSFEEVQVKEIAHALEWSGHRFLWSLRQPPPPPPQGGMMRPPGDYENPAEVLPEGFLERTAYLGKVIGWAPQAKVLSHRAVGGFVTHCGWNSTLESLWCGVPVAVWPIYAEQQMNAFLMVVELGLAMEVKLDYRKDMYNQDDIVLVTAGEIERGIRLLMDPENVTRKKVKEMSEKSKMSLIEGGSSYNSLGSFIEDILG